MFEQVKQQLANRFAEISQTSKLFKIEVDRDKVWQVYLDAFDPADRQSNNCNCCKSFLRQFAGIVGIQNNKIVTLWDFEPADPEYTNSVKAVRDYILSLPISDIFLHDTAKCGTDKNAAVSKVPGVTTPIIWQHYYLELPRNYVKKDFAPALGNARDDRNVLKRSLDEITDEAVDIVIELAGQGSLYRINEFLPTVKAFRELKVKYKKVPKALRDNFCWEASLTGSSAVNRIRNSAIGTLLVNLSEGMELENAVRAYEKVVAPANYKRPTALVTPRMVEEAKKRLEEMNMVGSIYRRLLTERDLSAENALFVHRAAAADKGDVFASMIKDSNVHPRSLGKVDEVSIEDFINKVLPTAKSVRALVENEHLGNLVSLVGPQNAEDPSMFKWDNNFSWSYTGAVADSIKERVKTAGGSVTGVLRISLAWQNSDDLDLHVIEPNGYKIYYGNKRTLSPSGGMLDVDMNAGGVISEDPVENVTWENMPKMEGRYKVIVNNFSYRGAQNPGFTVEVEYDGQISEFTHARNGTTGQNFTVFEFEYSHRNGIKLLSAPGRPKNQPLRAYNSREKWGIKTGQFHTVKAITLSPNHWTKPVGNKHYFFMLEGCKADEQVRPFYNEFLKPELEKDRKVFEVLGGKATVDIPEVELSGLGFSETMRNHMYVEVEGAFKRTLKINF